MAILPGGHSKLSPRLGSTDSWPRLLGKDGKVFRRGAFGAHLELNTDPQPRLESGGLRRASAAGIRNAALVLRLPRSIAFRGAVLGFRCRAAEAFCRLRSHRSSTHCGTGHDRTRARLLDLLQ